MIGNQFLEVPLNKNCTAEQNIEEYKDRYPKSLYRAVEQTRRFHDYELLKVEYKKDEYYFKHESNKLILTLVCEILGANDYYEIEFSDLWTVRFDTEYDKEIFTDRFSPFDMVHSTEIDVTGDGHFVFEAVLKNGTGYYIEFEKCRVLCHKKIK